MTNKKNQLHTNGLVDGINDGFAFSLYFRSKNFKDAKEEFSGYDYWNNTIYYSSYDANTGIGVKFEESIKEFANKHPDGVIVTNPPFSLFRDFINLIDAKVKKQYFSELLNSQNLKELDERRWFSLNDKEILIKNQNLNQENIGICNQCKNEFESQHLEVDHIIPWSLGGKTSLDNAQILCRSCNAKKSNK